LSFILNFVFATFWQHQLFASVSPKTEQKLPIDNVRRPKLWRAQRQWPNQRGIVCKSFINSLTF